MLWEKPHPQDANCVLGRNLCRVLEFTLACSVMFSNVRAKMEWNKENRCFVSSFPDAVFNSVHHSLYLPTLLAFSPCVLIVFVCRSSRIWHWIFRQIDTIPTSQIGTIENLCRCLLLINSDFNIDFLIRYVYIYSASMLILLWFSYRTHTVVNVMFISYLNHSSLVLKLDNSEDRSYVKGYWTCFITRYILWSLYSCLPHLISKICV